jgi:hypothetical protein
MPGLDPGIIFWAAEKHRRITSGDGEILGGWHDLP